MLACVTPRRQSGLHSMGMNICSRESARIRFSTRNVSDKLLGMRRILTTHTISFVILTAWFVPACSGDGSTSSGGHGGTGNSGGDGGGLFIDGGTSGGGGSGGDALLIYASTDTTLYRLDPTSADLTVTEIGQFDCIGSGADQYKAMTDIAVDRDQHLWGVTGHIIMPLTIGPGGTVACGARTKLVNGEPGQSLPTFYALTMAPVGVIDPNVEVLMAADSAGKLWAIDAAGKTTQHGSFGNVPADDGNGYTYDSANVGKVWEISGDIVFLANKGNPIGFATVRDCPDPPSSSGCNNTDTLLEIDMTKLATPGTSVVAKAIRGAIVKASGCADSVTKYGSMYGIAAWNDQVYGFSRTGLLVGINTNLGGACLVQDYPALAFSGAGVTTLAPVLPPPPK